MAPDGLRGDRAGQMMMLSAILLVIGFIALVGLVSRVNQLGSRTATETDQPILDQVAPMAKALDAAIAKFKATPATGGFGLSDTSTPKIEEAVVAYLEHQQMMQVRQGLFMDYQVVCKTAGDTATGQAVVRLTDGLVWVEVRSSQVFPRAACTVFQG